MTRDNEKEITPIGFIGGAVDGFQLGSKIGIVADPWGGIAGGIPCAIIGAIIGGLGGNKIGTELDRKNERNGFWK